MPRAVYLLKQLPPAGCKSQRPRHDRNSMLLDWPQAVEAESCSALAMYHWLRGRHTSMSDNCTAGKDWRLRHCSRGTFREALLPLTGSGAGGAAAEAPLVTFDKACLSPASCLVCRSACCCLAAAARLRTPFWQLCLSPLQKQRCQPLQQTTSAWLLCSAALSPPALKPAAGSCSHYPTLHPKYW